MEAPMPVVPFASPQKRPLEEDAQPSTPNRPSASTSSTPLSILSSVDTPSPLQKPASTNPTSTTTDVTVHSTLPLPQVIPAASSNAQPPAKRRKPNAQEKEAQRLEKEAKARARAEKKEQKEAEDKLKAEQREEERQKKAEDKKKKDEEKKKKEDEKRKKEEEKQKKERSQLKLNAFFVKPKVSVNSAENPMGDKVHNSAADPVSLVPDTEVVDTNPAHPPPQKPIQKDTRSDYERYFLPFSPPPHTIVAPYNAFFAANPEKLAASRARMEKIVAGEDIVTEPVSKETYRSLFPKRRRGIDTMSIIDIVKLVNSSADKPIDLTGSSTKADEEPLNLLEQIPMKYLHFSEDVRPPYYGTYTKPHTIAEGRRLARNPISRGLEELNYDYDSEAEWEEPEEGEDLDSEGEEDLEEEGDEDLDGFLDDEDDGDIKRRLLNGDQEPVSSGLCWEDARGVSILNDGSGAICTDFKDFKMGFLLVDPQPKAIDPFSTTYWTPAPTLPSTSNQPIIKTAATNLMNPPRLPLSSRAANGLLNTLNHPAPHSISPGSSSSNGAKPKQIIPADQLPAFKAEIDGQDLTKIAMIEALKKKFPKLGKQAIADTLGLVAKRVGTSQKDKVWVLL